MASNVLYVKDAIPLLVSFFETSGLGKDGKVLINNLRRFLEVFEYAHNDADIIDFFHTIRDNPELFCDYSQYQRYWKSFESVRSVLRCLTKTLECPAIATKLGADDVKAIKETISNFQKELYKKNKDSKDSKDTTNSVDGTATVTKVDDVQLEQHSEVDEDEDLHQERDVESETDFEVEVSVEQLLQQLEQYKNEKQSLLKQLEYFKKRTETLQAFVNQTTQLLAFNDEAITQYYS
jgi:hypothetical protein